MPGPGPADRQRHAPQHAGRDDGHGGGVGHALHGRRQFPHTGKSLMRGNPS